MLAGLVVTATIVATILIPPFKSETLPAGLTRIIHIFEDNKSLICYKHVVETVFEAANEASECLTIAQHSVCCSQEFFTSP
jgi:hypothetical protein